METVHLIILFALSNQPSLKLDAVCIGNKPLSFGAMCTMKVLDKTSKDGLHLVKSCDGFKDKGVNYMDVNKSVTNAHLNCVMSDKMPKMQLELK